MFCVLIHTHYTLRYAITSIYLYADTVSHWYIYIFSSQDTFSFCILCCLQWDSYTLIHIFKPIHTHCTQRYASTSIYVFICWLLIQLYVNTYIKLSRYILFLPSLPIKIGLVLIHWYIYFNRYIHTYTRQHIDIWMGDTIVLYTDTLIRHIQIRHTSESEFFLSFIIVKYIKWKCPNMDCSTKICFRE